MSIKANTLGFKIELGWTLSQDNGSNGLGASTQKGELSFLPTVNTTTWSLVNAGNASVAAGANTAINTASFSDLLNATQTAGNAAGFFVKAALANTSNTGGQLRVGPGDSDPLAWVFAGTDTTANANTVTLSVDATMGAGVAWWGGAAAVSDAAAQILVSNPGSNAITVTYGVILGS